MTKVGAAPEEPNERRIEGGVVAFAVGVPGAPDEVVLLDPSRRPEGIESWHPFHNVLRVGPEGEVRWRAELVPQETAAKCWTGLDFDGRLRATTYSYECVLDVDTGAILSTEFVK